MKFLYIFLLSVLIISCSSDSDNGANTDAANDGQGGSLASFTLHGNYLYTVDNQDLNVFNIEDQANPVLVNSIFIGFNIETLFGFKDYLYIGSQNGMFIYSVTNPEFPEKLSSVEHFTACDPVVANDNYAFVTLWSEIGCGNTVNQLEVYDVSQIEKPVLVNVRELQFPKGLGLYGDNLFVCDDSIKIFDVKNPENSTLVHSIDRFAFDVIIKDDHLLAIGENGLYQYQLNPENIEDIRLISEINF